MPDVVINCGMLAASTQWKAEFIPVAKWPAIVVSTFGCESDAVSVAGHYEPALDDWRTAFSDEIDHLLGRPIHRPHR